MSKVYVFFGHGWNINRNFEINTLQNVNIILMKNPYILCESRGNKHLRNAMKVGIGGYTALNYLEDLNKLSAENDNKFCEFSSENKHNIVPDMLLTTYSKDNELIRLQEIGSFRASQLPAQVMLLSELVRFLGNNIILEVYACRGHLDLFQVNNLEVFGPTAVDSINNKISEQKIRVLRSDDEAIATPPCTDVN